MIFSDVRKINTSVQKAFFVEKIDLYIRLVEVFCEKNKLPLRAGKRIPIDEFISIGVIIDNSGLPALKQFLGGKFEPFRKAVCFVEEHKNEVFSYVALLYNSYRSEKQDELLKSDAPALADFFCGAGGLSLGFRQVGFNVVLANDIEDVCIETYKYNHPEVPANQVIQGDIKNIVDDIDSYINKKVDIVVGGPPCQGFSSANKNHRVIDDPRNKLYKYFIEAVRKLAPKFVVMENVKGMLKVASQVVEDYQSITVNINGQQQSYKVAYRLLNSQNFSVAQSRERLIYIAIRDDVCKTRGITPESIFEEIISYCSSLPTYILSDALECIKPLEAQRERNKNEEDSNISGKKIDVNLFADNSNDYIKEINSYRYVPIIFNHKARYCSDLNYEIYRRLNQGDDATDEKVVDIMPYAHRNHCFKDKYYKLIANKPCRTITAHLRMDCHSHIHPFQVRSLTPREAARVQSFPDDYLFLGAYLKTYMQVGNAVPPLMARGIAKIIIKYIKEV